MQVRAYSPSGLGAGSPRDNQVRRTLRSVRPKVSRPEVAPTSPARAPNPTAARPAVAPSATAIAGSCTFQVIRRVQKESVGQIPIRWGRAMSGTCSNSSSSLQPTIEPRTQSAKLGPLRAGKFTISTLARGLRLSRVPPLGVHNRGIAPQVSQKRRPRPGAEHGKWAVARLSTREHSRADFRRDGPPLALSEGAPCLGETRA